LKVDTTAVTSGVKNSFNAGAHTASETTQAGYAASVWGGDCDDDGSITLALADDKTCTITNNDQQAYITVIKVVINDNGGSALPDDFLLTLAGTGTTNGTAVPVNPGTYKAGETLLSGYTFIGFSGDCDSEGNTTVALGESKTCTLTNDDIQQGTEWCGLTQGFWKNNILKYKNSELGRQVCDQFFENVTPGEVCNVDEGKGYCSCVDANDCAGWACVYDVFSSTKPKDQQAIQMMAFYMTQQYHISNDGNFYINCTKFDAECSKSLDVCDAESPDYNGGYPLLDDVWLELLDINNPNEVAGLADCINNYNDDQCAPTVTHQYCEQGTFNGLSCAVTSAFNSATTSGGDKRIKIKLS